MDFSTLIAGTLALLVLLVAVVAWRMLARLDAIEARLVDLAGRAPSGPAAAEAATAPPADGAPDLSARLAELVEEQRRLAVVVLERLVPEPGPGTVGTRADDGSPEDAARAWLAARGFERVHLLPAAAGEPGRFAWEGRRGTLLHKGRLLVRDGRVHEESSRSAASVFP